MKIIKAVIPIITLVIIVGLIIFNLDQDTVEEEIEEQWYTSGPFSIDKNQYNIGEKIFITVNHIPVEVSGEIMIFQPIETSKVIPVIEGLEGIPNNLIKEKIKYMGIKFDGKMKQNFNRYFEPRLNEWKGICSTNDLVGEWIIGFAGTNYEPLKFEILNQTSSWDERKFETLKNVGNC